MHELEGPRRSCAPCQAAIARHRPAAPDCSTSRRPRLLVACLSRNGCPEVPGSRSLGSRSSVDCPPRSHPADRSVARPSVDVSAAVSPVRSLGRVSFDELPRVGSRSRLLGCRSCAERGAPHGPPVPIARLRLLCGAGVPPTLPRSLGARQRGTAPPRHTPIARGVPSRDGSLPVGRRLLARPRLGTHHRSREPVSDRGLPRPATFRKSPSGPAPVPGDIASCSGRSDSPTRVFGPGNRRVLASTGRSTGQPGVVPR
jgi:hypothetical protein